MASTLQPPQSIKIYLGDETSSGLKHAAHYRSSHIIFKVEETLFRVDKSVLCQFDTFREMFEGAEAHVKDSDEGGSDDKPIVLQGVTAFEMESLLYVIEARWIKDPPEVSADQWKAALHLATMWEYEQLRQFAIEKIDGLKLPAIETLGLAVKCRVEKWLSPASVDLCLRANSLTYEEGEVLGFRFLTALNKIRESCLSMTSAVYPGTNCSNCGRIRQGSCRSCGQSYNRNGYYGTTCHCGYNTTTSSSNLTPQKQAAAKTAVDSILTTGLRPLPAIIYDKGSDNPSISGHHPIHYSGTHVTFQAEKTLFHVQETVLRQFLDLKDALDKVVFESGQSSRMFLLQGLTETEMATALDVLDARWFKGTPSFSIDQWKAVLKVATLLNHEELRQFSIGKIDDLKPPPLDLILLSRKCNVAKWWTQGCIDLCMRPQSMTAEEGTQLGIGLFADLFRIREGRKSSYCSYCQNLTVTINCSYCNATTLTTVTAAVAMLPPDAVPFSKEVRFMGDIGAGWPNHFSKEVRSMGDIGAGWANPFIASRTQKKKR
ncbi:hypothetical protein FRC02_009525 [Tulasnella sp. 418]|nr:hypothetical protein FRC02_009525 [Tulasnella sp. 418]